MKSGELIKRYRSEHGLTQRQLADELNKIRNGYTTSLISNIECGIVELPQDVYNSIAVKTFEKPFRNRSDARKGDGWVDVPPSQKKSFKSSVAENGGKKMRVTQRDRVLDYIREFGSITSREAFVDLGVTQLAARICELNDRGYEFDKNYESSKNRFGENVSFVRYSLKEVS